MVKMDASMVSVNNLLCLLNELTTESSVQLMCLSVRFIGVFMFPCLSHSPEISYWKDVCFVLTNSNAWIQKTSCQRCYTPNQLLMQENPNIQLFML